MWYWSVIAFCLSFDIFYLVFETFILLSETVACHKMKLMKSNAPKGFWSLFSVPQHLLLFLNVTNQEWWNQDVITHTRNNGTVNVIFLFGLTVIKLLVGSNLSECDHFTVIHTSYEQYYPDKLPKTALRNITCFGFCPKLGHSFLRAFLK